MTTFGYKNIAGGILRAVAAIAIGIVMVVVKANALELVVSIIGAFLLATGVVSLFVGIRRRSYGDSRLLTVNACVDVLLGVLLFLFPQPVSNLLVFLIGFALLGFGLMQIISLISAGRTVGVNLSLFILPVLVVISGGFLIANPRFLGNAVGIVAGISLIVYGLSDLLAMWKIRKTIKDMDYENVDEQ